MLFLHFVKKYVLLHTKKISFVKSEMIELTLDEQKEYENATYCHICNKEFTDKRKNIEKYVIMIITLVNIVALLIIFAIYVILLKKIWLHCFITVVTMILT